MADNDRPEGLETKSTEEALTYRPAAVPHISRTGSELTDDERRRADEHGDITKGGTGTPEDQPAGVTTASGGKTSKPAAAKSS